MPAAEFERGLVKAAVEVLRPIVAQMIAKGIVFGHLESRLRELFVRVAETSFEIPGRPQTDSRISVLTGINRKEVRRIRTTHPRNVRPTSFERNLATDLVSRWSADSAATDRSGHPLPIPFRAKQGPSFVRLVRETTSDLRPRAILDELLRVSDVFVITAALTTETVGRIGSRELGLMKEDAIFINVARGEIVDEAALYQHLKAHPRFFAGIDAWWVEPVRHGRFEMGHPFLDLPNVIGSPHNSAGGGTWRDEYLRRAVANCRRTLLGKTPWNLIGPDERML